MKIFRVCKLCKKDFCVTKSASIHNKSIYCSRECYHKSTNTKKVISCETCGKETKNKRFCSKNCMGKSLENKSKCTCILCGNSFDRKKSEIAKGGGKFCSHKCLTSFYSGERSTQWRGGTAYLPYPSGWKSNFKKLIRERDGNRCVECGCPQRECFQNLHVHHIDYDKNNLDSLNLITLCPSCHVKTNTHNREHWKLYFLSKQNT